MKQTITIIKRNLSGEEMWRYTGIVLRREKNAILVEAIFNRADLPFLNTILRQGDRFVEMYYINRWYNIFEIHDRDDDRFKGWYCNICKPAEMEAESVISYVDLALDLWVAPDGTQTVLDEDEFVALDLDAYTETMARAAMEELQVRFTNNKEPDLY